ncbi:MAG: hypothetical protein ABIZ91_03015 [Gemmatimonadaceae bacterium]
MPVHKFPAIGRVRPVLEPAPRPQSPTQLASRTQVAGQAQVNERSVNTGEGRELMRVGGGPPGTARSNERDGT